MISRFVGGGDDDVDDVVVIVVDVVIIQSNPIHAIPGIIITQTMQVKRSKSHT